MKISLLNRDVANYAPEVRSSRKVKYFNHEQAKENAPLVQAKEYRRAVQAAKMERIFAKPFVHQFQGHLDTVKVLARCNTTVYDFVSGSCDGELRFWNLNTRDCKRSVLKAHEGFIEGLTISKDDKYVLSCGKDRYVKQWAFQKHFGVDNDNKALEDDSGNYVDATQLHTNLWSALEQDVKPVNSFMASSALTGVDYHDEQHRFATSGEVVSVWDTHRSAPTAEMKGATNDSFMFVKWSKSDTHLLLSATTSNHVELFDTRQADAVNSMMLNGRSNAACWNPMKPFEYAVANDDSNVYVFDVRNWSKPQTIHFGFVHAALSVDYSPTGRELAAGGFDQTVRIWRDRERRSREVYHNRRMQQVTSILFSGDSKFVLSGSADFSIRLWKSVAHERLETLNNTERHAVQYREALKEKFKHMPEVSQIVNKRQVPKYIHNIAKNKRAEMEATKRKVVNSGHEMQPLKERVVRQPK